MNAEVVGWLAAAILSLTLLRQIVVQWRSKTTQGVSKWLFVGQVAASVLFVVYSWLLQNWVFVVTNSLILLIAIGGQVLYMHMQRQQS